MDEGSVLAGIGSGSIERVVQLRVREGADLLRALGDAVKREKIETGVIVSGIGALNRAVFRNLKVFPETFPVRTQDRLYEEVTTPMELVTLGGWIATEPHGETHIHAHFSASTVRGESVVTMGGHLTEGTVAGIKVVVAIAVLGGDSAGAEIDEHTLSPEITFPGP